MLRRGSSREPHVADRQADLLAQTRRPKLGEQHRAGARARAAVARALGLGERRGAPAVVGVEVQLVLEDDEARVLEEGDPLERRPLQLPALVVAHAGRDAEEQAPVACEDAVQLAQSRLLAAVVARRVDAVDGVVEADVLQRRDEEREVEAAVRERELADVGDHVGGLREVDGDELRCAEVAQTVEVRGDRVRRADVEDAPLAAVAGEAPGDLDRPLVAPLRREQLARPAAPRPLEPGARERRRRAARRARTRGSRPSPGRAARARPRRARPARRPPDRGRGAARGARPVRRSPSRRRRLE